MPHAQVFRVRWFRPRPELVALADGGDAASACLAAATDRTLVVTAEADGGGGRVVYAAVGGAGIVWTDDHATDAIDVVLRIWDVEGAEEEVGVADSPQFLLGEFAGEAAEIFPDLDVPRVLTAERVGSPDDAIEVLAIRWWDPSEYEALLAEWEADE